MQNAAPSANLQFYGVVAIDAGTGAMTVELKDLLGITLYLKVLAARRG